METDPVMLTHEMFGGWAVRQPDAVAAVSGEVSLTFGELEVWAGRLAGVLRGCGVGPEVAVGVCLPRGVGWLVALLAVFKAGGVYVPLDAGYPAARLEFMVRDAGVAVVVGAGAAAAGVASVTGCPLVEPGGGFGDLPVAEGGDVGAVAAHPDNLAYVIYTSGSTGRPKGVQITHASLANLLASTATPLQVGPGRRTLQCVSFGFDMSLADSLVTLTHGGTLVIASAQEVASPDLLARRLLADRIHTVVLPPTVLAPLAAYDFPELRVVASGGEICPPRLAATLADRVAFVNGYGPTETAVAVSLHPVAPGAALPDRVPIGTALPRTAMHIVHDGTDLAARGETGEICVGGAGVARGYLGRPGQTAAAFVPDPFSAVPGARMYRTGDLGAELPDGTVDFRGRADRQVKVRGHRVELGEIERALAHHPGVGQAAVVVTDPRPVGRQILAYITPVRADEPAPPGDVLRRYLAAELPAHMLPNSVTTLRELPLTAHLKTDYTALADRPPEGAGAQASAPAPARTPLEEGLLRIWREVLGETEIGIRDDFFALGGHSLLAAQVVARIRARHEVHLSPGMLLERGRTVEELAREVERAAAGGDPVRPPITRIRRPARTPLSASPRDVNPK